MSSPYYRKRERIKKTDRDRNINKLFGRIPREQPYQKSPVIS